MDEARFWAMIEEAWHTTGSANELRAKVLDSTIADDELQSLHSAIDDKLLPELQQQLLEISPDELLVYDRMIERKLFDIDRREIFEHLAETDDGFLATRGFIVAIGKKYYDSVLADPARAVKNEKCEEICYMSWHTHRELFGKAAPSGISRETKSNAEGWK